MLKKIGYGIVLWAMPTVAIGYILEKRVPVAAGPA